VQQQRRRQQQLLLLLRLVGVQADWLSPADNGGEAQFVQIEFEKVVRGTAMWIYFTPLDVEDQVLVYGLSAKVCHKPCQSRFLLCYRFLSSFVLYFIKTY